MVNLVMVSPGKDLCVWVTITLSRRSIAKNSLLHITSKIVHSRKLPWLASQQRNYDTFRHDRDMTLHDPWMATGRPSSILWVFAHRSASGWRIRRVACPTWVRTCQKKWMDQGLIWIPKLLERAQNSKRILSVRAFFSRLLCSFHIISQGVWPIWR